jgi:hypothetical protein
MSNALVQVILNQFSIIFLDFDQGSTRPKPGCQCPRYQGHVLGCWTYELKSYATLGVGLCLNQLFILFYISFKLVNE